MSERNLSELLEFISGKGQFVFKGKGITSYPNGNDNNKKIHAECIAAGGDLNELDIILKL